MTTALPPPAFIPLFTQWAWQPVAIALVLALALWYARLVRQLTRSGRIWPAHRSALFGVGLALAIWTTCGFLQAYLASLYWAWTTQVLALWLAIPAILLAGQPLQLSLAVHGERTRLARVLRSRFARVLSNPLVGPALVPALSAVLFFGRVPVWGAFTPAFGWVLQPALVVVGALILLPILGVDGNPTALAVAMGLAIGSLELVLDAVPGIVLRLHQSLVSSYFNLRVAHPWSPADLHDQQTAGTVLWVIAEILDLPFLLLVFRQWLRADARDAAAVDAVLEAEHAARTGVSEDSPDQSDHGVADTPWWVNDPAWQQRLRGR